MNHISKHSQATRKEKRNMNTTTPVFEQESRDMKKGKNFFENK